MKQPPARRFRCCCCVIPFGSAGQGERDAERAIVEPPKPDDLHTYSFAGQTHDSQQRKDDGKSIAELETPDSDVGKRGRPGMPSHSTGGESSQANEAINTALRFPSPPRRSVETQDTLEEDGEGRREEPPPTYETAMSGK